MATGSASTCLQVSEELIFPELAALTYLYRSIPCPFGPPDARQGPAAVGSDRSF